MNAFDDFLKWETTTRDVLDFKKIYVDMAGDVLAGLMLSELVYWHLPAKDGNSRLRVQHGGRMWIAARRYEWWLRCRLSPRQADRAGGILVKRGFVEKQIFKFKGEPTVHYSLNRDAFLKAWGEAVETPAVNPYSPIGENAPNLRNGENDIPDTLPVIPDPAIPLTESTTEITAETTLNPSPLAAAGRVEKETAISKAENPEPEPRKGVELYPEDVRETARLFCETFSLVLPGKPKAGARGGRYADWIKSFRVLAEIATDHNLTEVEDMRRLINASAWETSRMRLTVGRPGAILKIAEAAAVKLTYVENSPAFGLPESKGLRVAREFLKRHRFDAEAA